MRYQQEIAVGYFFGAPCILRIDVESTLIYCCAESVIFCIHVSNIRSNTFCRYFVIFNRPYVKHI